MQDPIPASWFHVEVPEGQRGQFRVERFTVTPDGAALDAMISLFSSSSGGRWTPAGTYTRLVTGGLFGVCMSDTPDEIRDHRAPVSQARRGGQCLVNGLGLGMVAQAMLEAGAEKVTVVEINSAVIELVEPHYRERYGARFEVVHADALTWRPAPKTRFSVVWHDIWSAIRADNLSDMTVLHRAYGRRAEWQGSWCQRDAELRGAVLRRTAPRASKG